MSFIRRIKKTSGTYLAEVENYREDGKVKQRVLKYIGKEVEGKPVRRVKTSDVRVLNVTRSLDVELIDQLATQLGLKDVISPNILLMVYSQLLDRPAINKLKDWLAQTEILNVLNIDGISTSKLYDSFDKLNEINFNCIEDKLYESFKEYEDSQNTVVIDITDTYFEGRKIKGKRRKGKDGKIKKLIQIGLGVTQQYGFPILHRKYDGNISNSKVFREMVLQLWERGFNSIIVDRGMYTKTNLATIHKLNGEVICGISKTAYFKKHYLDGIDRESIYMKKNRVKLKNTQVYINSVDFESGKLIIIYNPHLEYVKRELHYEKGGKEGTAKYMGYSLVYHNSSLPDKAVVPLYFEKDIVERSFRQLKGILSVRPVRFWLPDHVEAHVKICYLAYAILSLLSYRVRDMEISALDALEQMKSGYKVYLSDEASKFKWDTTVTMRASQQKILDVVYKMG